MITALDTSVLLAIFKPEHSAQTWLKALETAAASGQLVISEIVYAELAASFTQIELLDRRLNALGVALIASTKTTLFEAGLIFKRYRMAGGIRSNMVPDFLIGAHALRQADQLASTDRGYLRAHFAGLTLLSI